MTKDKRGFPIRLKLFLALVASLLLAALVFYTVSRVGNFLVWRYYLDESDKRERAESYVEKFQKYVTENKLTTDNADLISEWDPGRYVDFIVYKDSNLLYAPEWFEDFTQSELEEPTDIEDGEVEENTAEANDDVQGDVGGDEPDSAPADEAETELQGGGISGGSPDVEVDSADTGGVESEDESGSAEESDSESDSEQLSETESETESGVVTDKSFYEQWFLGDRGFEQYLTEEARKNYVTALEDALGDDNALYPVYFVDGTLIVAVVDFTEEFFSNLVFVISVLAGLVVIAVIMICYFGTITKRITLLQKSVRKIEQGDFDHKITQRGRDEIGLLARDVESMRDSIVENMTRERRAWEANAGLITAMSHDIRTPLTVLLGYLDLIEMQNDGQISEEYIASCRENAMRLKNLSDDMFSYFLVFGKGDGEITLSRVDARMLVEHIVSEYTLLLSERGYSFEMTGELPAVYLDIEERYFRRVMDNIFSNIIKYADSTSPVLLGVERGEDTLGLYCQNKTRTDKDIPESNGIGLRTCAKMMEEMGGGLSYGEVDGIFTVALTLPIGADESK